MILFKTALQLSEYLTDQKKSGQTIGFVPTMGALHPGHLSLVAASKKANGITVCSIFVNPTQFTNAEDFEQYPVTIEKDIEQLEGHHCDVLFLPPTTEIYPPGYVKKQYALGRIESILEGHYRPGHFQGVCQVVDRLLEIVAPDRLYLGQKDFQQCIVIKKLIRLLGKEKEIEVNIIPTVREADGLAMSSRNLRLDEDQRKLATFIYQALHFIKENLSAQPLDQLASEAAGQLRQKGFDVDYIAIAQAADLSPANTVVPGMVALAAAATRNIRLIDNLILN
jgi:pantoate--beta-alanine ligase